LEQVPGNGDFLAFITTGIIKQE